MTNHGAITILAIVGGLAALFLVVLAALVTYDVLVDDGMMDGMWDMVDDMGGMMDGDMHGMMGGGGPETTGSASGQGTVRIVDFSFQPTIFTVTPGTVITWTNEDSAPHTATAESFDTGRLDEGESGEVTFYEPGAYDYICTYHPSMEGRVIVEG
ncbi:MAG TPA: cupredoxin family copper-binding protein [Dehalococcoidia bacterium]|nr:cupredoxin family copper-binding protein [Dehalococcoidia bacterium]